MTDSSRYQVSLRVRGELAPAWSAIFADLAVEPGPDGTTLLRGVVGDQAAVHGLLDTIRDLGLALLSAETVALPQPLTSGGQPCRS